ncbi:MAG: peroxiredoxin family protein [Bdellovibrionales bacterium]|nr:peroxiredoxin family protein [Bdellovibrionales bacterium]
MNRVASDFSGQTWKGEPINLSQYKGKKIWLAFFRYSSCPLCNLRISEMITNYEKWQQKNLEILAVFQSGPDNIKRYVGKQEPPFTIIADPEQKLYELYKVGNDYKGFASLNVMKLGTQAMLKGFLPGVIEGDPSRIPADFLINEIGIYSVLL